MSPSPRERFVAALRGEAQDAPTGWMMRQAGRFLPEYRAMREGRTFVEAVEDPEFAAEVTLQPIRRFGMDVAVIFCDILMPPKELGLDLSFEAGHGPKLVPTIREKADLALLNDFDPRVACAYLPAAIAKVRATLAGMDGGDRGIMGFCGAPFTTASYMVEGASSRNFEHTKRLMLTDPETFSALQAKLVDHLIPYLAMQVEAGADALQIFDSWGGNLDAANYRRYLLPHLKRLVAGAKETGAPVVIYLNGGSHLLEVLAEAEPDCIGLDYRVDIADARRRLPNIALQGNLDPTTLFTTPEIVEAGMNRTLDAFKGHPGHVFNVGSGLLPKTSIACVERAFETLRARR